MQLAKAIEVLSDAEVDFVIIGGVAAIFHGSSRVTYDLDICYSRSASNLRRLVVALAPFHPRPRGFPRILPFVWDEGTLRNATVLTLQTDIGSIDLLAEVPGLGTFAEVKRDSIMVEAFERQIASLDLPGLIQSKRAAGREKDISALPELEGLLEAVQ
ncbi:MAG: nucleotidyltransferase [Acidobacteriota bacterium]|nr:nucleotidyltransferase [Acidobacteriota bacterium]